MRTSLPSWISSRRRFLGQVALGGAALAGTGLWAPGAFAEELMRTPRQTEGPFYPDKMPLDTDNDLLIVNDSITPAVGDITHMSGIIRDAKGDPIRNAVVEIWQVDHNANYIHTKGEGGVGKRDTNFQGFGRFLTSSTGEYYFRTIKPVPYPGRTPHIHVAVKVKGQETFTTQCYIKGFPGNANDGVFSELRDAKSRDALAVDFTPMKESKIGELAVKFNVVLGFTPKA